MPDRNYMIMLDFLQPQLCNHVDKSFLDSIDNLRPYICERKFDGTRIMTYVTDNEVHMFTRNGKTDIANKYPDVSNQLLQFDNVIFDGEFVFLDRNNNIEFQSALITPETVFSRHLRPCYIIFDVLYHDDEKLDSLPLFLRRKHLCDMDVTNKNIMLSETFDDPNIYKNIFEHEVQNNGEGIVLKKRDGKYLFGKRKEWLKIKRQDTRDGVIIGITPGEGKYKDSFGALIVGDMIDGKLKVIAYCSGMNDSVRQKLYDVIMNMPEMSYSIKFGKPVLRTIEPKICVELEYMEQTEYGYLRHPRFCRIRDDKSIDVPSTFYSKKDKIKSIFDF